MLERRTNQMAPLQRSGYKHSVPVPQIYKRASKIAKAVKEGKDSLKNLVFQEKHVNIKCAYALIVETFKRDDIISKLIEKSQLLINHPRFDPWLAKILICEMLWGKNKMTGNSKPVQTILGFKEQLEELLPTCENTVKDVLKHNVEKPRYARINTLKVSISEAIDNFVEEGWKFVPLPKVQDYEGFLHTLNTLKPDEFMLDFHIPDLLIFPPRTEFHRHEAYKSRSIILQDKASCLPVHLLNPTPGSTVLDMCAAPGMKTTQLAAMLRDSGTVYAVELNEKREKLLREFVASTGATCVKTLLKDVMKVKNDDCPGVEYVLVDPSCSGSGITDRVEVESFDFSDRVERLRKLNNFQSKLLRHALNVFPKAKRIVYSTCSINSEENEDVVRQVLETCRYYKLIDARKILKSWNESSSKVFPELGNMCVYATPEKDRTNGFFVAVFERLAEGERNPFLNVQLCKMYGRNIEKANDPNSQSTEVTEEQDYKKKQKKKTEIGPTPEGKENEEKVFTLMSDEVKIEQDMHLKKKKKKTRDIATIIHISDDATSHQSNGLDSEVQEKEIKDEGKKKKRKKDKENIEDSNVVLSLENSSDNIKMNSTRKGSKKKANLDNTQELNFRGDDHEKNVNDSLPDLNLSKPAESESSSQEAVENVDEAKNVLISKKTKKRKIKPDVDCEVSLQDKRETVEFDSSNIEKKKKKKRNTNTELSVDLNTSEIKKKKHHKNDQLQLHSEELASNQNEAEIINVETDQQIIKKVKLSKTKKKNEKSNSEEDPLVEQGITLEHSDLGKIEKDSNSEKKKSKKNSKIDNGNELDEMNDQSVPNNESIKKTKKRKSEHFEDLENSAVHENTSRDVKMSKKEKKKKQTRSEIDESTGEIGNEHKEIECSIIEEVTPKKAKKKKSKELDSSNGSEHEEIILDSNVIKKKRKKEKTDEV